MSRLFVNQFKENDVVSDVYRMRNKTLRTDKRGSRYLQFSLSDRTGSVVAFFWNATDEFAQKFSEGDFVRVEGGVQLYQNKIQVVARKLVKVETSEVVADDFVEHAEQNVDNLGKRLREILDTVKRPALRALVKIFLDDKDFMANFSQSYAGVRLHHAYVGGLLEHTVATMELAQFIAEQYPKIVNRDLLIVGAFLHDVGKTVELSGDALAPVYSDEGQALGHLYLGAELLDRKIKELEFVCGTSFDPILALKLKHMILSHHGTPEFGSPKVPMSREAIALHFIDSLDAKLNEFQKFIMDDASASNWTNYNALLDRKLLK